MAKKIKNPDGLVDMSNEKYLRKKHETDDEKISSKRKRRILSPAKPGTIRKTEIRKAIKEVMALRPAI